MQLLGRFKTFVGSTIAALGLIVMAAASPASAQVSVGVSVGAPVYYNTAPGCPVNPYDLQNVLSGQYGVDGLGRPVNAYGFPVDVYGNCLTGAPVVEIFNYQPAPFYVNFLWAHYHWRYYYRPGFVHMYSGPGVHVYSSYGRIPAGHTRVIIQQNYHSPVHTVTPVGPARTVRPGTPAAGVPAAGATHSLRPGVSAPPAAAPTSVTPPRAAAPTTTFKRPTAAPAAPAYHAPSTVTPPRAAAPTRTFSRPSSSGSSRRR